MEYDREMYYYLRDSENRPIITVCLLSNNGTVSSRGVAICSDRDLPCKKMGRNIAKGRAVQALIGKRNNGDINRDEALVVLMRIFDPQSNCVLADGMNKAIFKPILTGHEERLLGYELAEEISK